MQRRAMMMGTALLALSACGIGAPPPRPLVGEDGLPLPTITRITPEMEAEIGYRMVESVNSLRAAAGAGPVSLDAALNAAAATHSRDMAVQNRPWHFGSDGSSPNDRLARVGYRGALVGEVISETYETELQTLGAWMEDPQTRTVILNRAATRLGLAWFQEESGKIWWTMVLAA
jgi:uncharacterized protein YkwD